ncbi:MAG: siphovirus ReqiPepy6 Gp37-like family protein [Bacteroidales bacterium]|nr:siphovirus ReqiPepy6 Gp37-like family protein [Bacteroidales bacterium]
MEFLICDANRMEVSILPETATIDMAIGDTNDVEIQCQVSDGIENGMYLICPGTEFGALLEDVKGATNSEDITWTGLCFRGFLEQIIIEPPKGEAYRIVSGDANKIISEIIGDAFDGMFIVSNISSGINISSYQFERYTDALTGLTKMLAEQDARINIEIIQGATNEAFQVILSAVPIQNLTEEIEYSQDSGLAVTIEKCRSGITHLICLGQGELEERTVIHLYLQADGSVGTKQYYTGLYDRVAVYDYSSAQDEDELIKGGEERLLELAPYENMELSVGDELSLCIGDIIGGRNYETGLYIAKPIIKEIIKVEGGITTNEIEVEGND